MVTPISTVLRELRLGSLSHLWQLLVWHGCGLPYITCSHGRFSEGRGGGEGREGRDRREWRGGGGGGGEGRRGGRVVGRKSGEESGRGGTVGGRVVV